MLPHPATLVIAFACANGLKKRKYDGAPTMFRRQRLYLQALATTCAMFIIAHNQYGSMCNGCMPVHVLNCITEGCILADTMKDVMLHKSQPVKLRDAIRRMRELSELNIPFSFSFASYSEVLQKSDGYKVIDKALLRPGYRSDQSHLSNILIAYTDFDQKESDRQFYLPLLLTFNNHPIVP